MNRAFVNLIAFQACWFASVLGAASGLPWLGPLFAALWLPLHIRATGSFMVIETKLILAAGALGYVLDSAIVLSGGMSFPAQAQLGAPTTLWMVTLWLGFAATLRHVLGWIRGRYILAALLGGIAGPFAYWSGSKLGAVVLTDMVFSLAMVGVEWSIAMPLLLVFISRLERSDCTSTQAARQAVW
jgi:hypothetical protein